MKKIKALSAAAILLLAVSCSKSKNDFQPPTSNVTKKLKTVSYTDPSGNVNTDSYQYDQQGQLKSYSSDEYTYSFTYVSPTQLIESRSIQGVKDAETTCTINDKGAITKMVKVNIPANTIYYTYEFEYNADNYLIKAKGYAPAGSNNFEETFEIVDGNPVSSKLYHDGVLSSNRVYLYDASKANKMSEAAWSMWPSETHFGKTRKNLLIEFKTFNPSNVLNWHQKNSYQLDADGYPTKMTIDYVHENTKSTTHYVYE